MIDGKVQPALKSYFNNSRLKKIKSLNLSDFFDIIKTQNIKKIQLIFEQCTAVVKVVHWFGCEVKNSNL